MQEDLYPRWFNKLPATSRSNNSSAENPYPKLIAWLVLLLFVFLILNNLWIWFSITILADENIITSYLQENTGPESSLNIADANNQAFIEGVATSALQTALFTFLLAIVPAFAWLRISSKKNN